MSSKQGDVNEEWTWFYLDRKGKEFGPFPTSKMRAWERHNFFNPKLLVRCDYEEQYVALNTLGDDPFLNVPPRAPPAPSLGDLLRLNAKPIPQVFGGVSEGNGETVENSDSDDDYHGGAGGGPSSSSMYSVFVYIAALKKFKE